MFLYKEIFSLVYKHAGSFFLLLSAVLACFVMWWNCVCSGPPHRKSTYHSWCLRLEGKLHPFNNPPRKLLMFIRGLGWSWVRSPNKQKIQPDQWLSGIHLPSICNQHPGANSGAQWWEHQPDPHTEVWSGPFLFLSRREAMLCTVPSLDSFFRYLWELFFHWFL